MRKFWILPLITLSIFIFLFTFKIVSAQSKLLEKKKSFSAFPILLYDSDIGFGYGGKGTIKNIYKKNESFDLILFNSSKGQQWYSFAFSIPDFEIRQGEKYPLALDLKIEYDKRIKSNFFGFGNDSQDNEFQFIREYAKLEFILSRAFTERIIGEIGYRLTPYSAYGFNPTWGTITAATSGAGESIVSLMTARIRWDTRDSQIHPKRGFRAFYSIEYSAPGLGSDWDYTKHRLEISRYNSIWGNHVLASRFWLENVAGSAPYQEMSKIGGSWTARGYKADRFLDKSITLVSMEYRFPIFKKLGGVVFRDLGRVYDNLNNIEFSDWHSNWGWGLRFYLANFVVRMDIGKSTEGSRLFFHFGHVF